MYGRYHVSSPVLKADAKTNSLGGRRLSPVGSVEEADGPQLQEEDGKDVLCEEDEVAGY